MVRVADKNEMLTSAKREHIYLQFTKINPLLPKPILYFIIKKTRYKSLVFPPTMVAHPLSFSCRVGNLINRPEQLDGNGV